MTHPDTTGPLNLVYDPELRASNFQISGWRRGKPFVVSGCLPVPVSPTLTRSPATSVVSKEAIKVLLREIIAAVDQSPLPTPASVVKEKAPADQA